MVPTHLCSFSLDGSIGKQIMVMIAKNKWQRITILHAKRVRTDRVKSETISTSSSMEGSVYKFGITTWNKPNQTKPILSIASWHTNHPQEQCIKQNVKVPTMPNCERHGDWEWYVPPKQLVATRESKRLWRTLQRGDGELTRRKHPTFLTLVQFLVTSGSHKATLLQFYSLLQNDRSLPKLETFGVWSWEALGTGAK